MRYVTIATVSLHTQNRKHVYAKLSVYVEMWNKFSVCSQLTINDETEIIA